MIDAIHGFEDVEPDWQSRFQKQPEISVSGCLLFGFSALITRIIRFISIYH
jgi:hypothetical protein